MKSLSVLVLPEDIEQNKYSVYSLQGNDNRIIFTGSLGECKEKAKEYFKFTKREIKEGVEAREYASFNLHSDPFCGEISFIMKDGSLSRYLKFDEGDKIKDITGPEEEIVRLWNESRS